MISFLLANILKKFMPIILYFCLVLLLIAVLVINNMVFFYKYKVESSDVLFVFHLITSQHHLKSDL